MVCVYCVCIQPKQSTEYINKRLNAIVISAYKLFCNDVIKFNIICNIIVAIQKISRRFVLFSFILCSTPLLCLTKIKMYYFKIKGSASMGYG